MKRKIVITYQDTNNETKSKTISYANTSASDQNLLDFTNDIFDNLTNNTVIQAEKVDTSILEESE